MSLTSGKQLILTSAAGGGGYAISRSLRFNSSDSAYLSRTPASAGNRKTWTWAGWVKRSKLSASMRLLRAVSGGTEGGIQLLSGNAIELYDYSGGYTWQLVTSQLFRDASAWYHLVIAFDTTQGTAANRVSLYVNGTKVSAFSTSSYPSQNFDGLINTTNAHAIAGSDLFFDGYLADIHFIDGQALDPTSFGEFDDNGIWQPIAYTGSYGTNGFHLDFADNSTAAALGTDSSGAGNTWTVNNLSVTAGAGNDSLVDVPTNGSEVDTGVGGEVRGNYCTLNALVNASVNTYANGNLECYFPAATANATAFGTIAVSSGKWYWECQRNDISSGLLVGIARVDANPASLIGSQVLSYAYKDSNGNKINNGTSSAYGATFNTANIIGVALDLDAGTLTFYKDNVSQGTAFSGISGSFFPAWSEDSAGGGSGVNVNFGSRSFIYTAPSGFKALCTANLPAPVVTKPSDLFDVKLYTGNGSTQTISGLGFSPDLVWTKARNTNYSHQLIDIIRGGTTVLFSDRTQAEGTYSSITSFNSDGYTVSTELGVNGSGDSFAAWCWDAGSSTVTNTQGSISSQVRANASAGFSIVTYTGNSTVGATVGHGLGVAPQLIIIKARNNVSGGFWQVYHQAIGNTKYLELNSTSAAGTSSNRWNNTTPSSTVFTLGSDSDLNGSLNYVAYCFAPVAGYANAFSYTGTGGEGPMVYLGMRPRLVLIKRTDSTGSWFLFDAARSPYNETRKYLLAESSAAEGDDGDITNGWQLDFLSNGFKIRADAALQLNANGGTYVGFAWAESPFQYARAR